MNIYGGLLFLHGHVQDPGLARSLAADHAAPAEAEPTGQEPADAGDECGQVGRAGHPRPWRRGAIASICSVALSPFR